MLMQALESSEDMNAVAAIILPLDDYRVEAKIRGGHGEGIVLTQSERVRLWRGDSVPADRWWVYDRGEKEWWLFRRRLLDAVAQDEFDLRFVCLFGSDNIQRRAPVPWQQAFDCNELIVSEGRGRPADFAIPGEVLSRLPECSPWVPVSQDESEVKRRAAESTAWILGGMALICPLTFARSPVAGGE